MSEYKLVFASHESDFAALITCTAIALMIEVNSGERALKILDK